MQLLGLHFIEGTSICNTSYLNVWLFQEKPKNVFKMAEQFQTPQPTEAIKTTAHQQTILTKTGLNFKCHHKDFK